MDSLCEFHSHVILGEFHSYKLGRELNFDMMKWESYSHAMAWDLQRIRIEKVSIPKVCFGNFVPTIDFVKYTFRRSVWLTTLNIIVLEFHSH